MKEFASENSFIDFIEKIRYSNRYFFDGESQAFFEALISTRAARIRKCKSGTIFWRAQLGCKTIQESLEGCTKIVKQPFDVDRMIPLKKQAKGGRANPSGIPHLYLATTKETAMAEVRPWLGSIISLATFETTKELSTIDCFTDNIENSNNLDVNPNSKEQKVWSDINYAFSKPILLEEQDTDYVSTQIISEFFRRHGYDGIFYKSMLGDGLNIVLFNMDFINIVSRELYTLDKINFLFKKIE
jgi:hypothetical protein